MGKFGSGMRNREGQEQVTRNVMARAGSFLQKWESHNITYWSGQHRTELNLVVVRTRFGGRQRQLWRVKDYKSVAGEHVTTQHKLVVFLAWMKKRREVKSRGHKIMRSGSVGETSSLSTRRG